MNETESTDFSVQTNLSKDTNKKQCQSVIYNQHQCADEQGHPGWHRTANVSGLVIFGWYESMDPGGPPDVTVTHAKDVLEDTQKRVGAVSAGPWEVEYDTCGCSADGYCGQGCKEPYPYAIIGPVNAGQVTGYENSVSEIAEMTEADVAFVANARQDVPALLAYITAGHAHTLAFVRTLNDGTVYKCVCKCGQELSVEDDEEGPVFEKHRTQEQERAMLTTLRA